ncbi:MAG: sporulation protein YabP [Clostridia bacterium]|nr:sporulation protein YabP [Clostridia bacterium]
MADNKRILWLCDRSELKITGVGEVVSFDENGAVLLTECGELSIDGQNIHISNLDTESGEVHITGRIDAIVYADDAADKKRGLLGKLFG